MKLRWWAFGVGVVLIATLSWTASARTRALRKRSMSGGRGSAPLAFFVCRDAVHMGIRGPTPDAAQARCERVPNHAPCRCTGHDSVAVYGPFTYPRPTKREWFALRDYPYEGSNGEHYTRDGYLPTP